MTTKVLLTHHHRDAIENAADRGFWMPLPLEAEQLGAYQERSPLGVLV